MNSWGPGNPKITAWFFLVPWQTPLFGFCITKLTTQHLRWSQIMNWHWRGFHKTAKRVCSRVLSAKSIILEKLFVFKGLLPLDPLKPEAGFHSTVTLCGLSVCSCHCTCVFWIGWSFPLLPGWCPHGGKDTVREGVSIWGRASTISSDHIPIARSTFYLPNHMRLNENLTNFLELSLSLSPWLIRHHWEN